MAPSPDEHARHDPTDGPDLALSVVVPAYRAAREIGSTVARIHEELADIAAGGGLEVVVVDDGSDDDTTEVAIAAGAEQVLTMPVNRGKGAAVRAGMAATRGRVVAFTDADLAYGPEHLRRLMEKIDAGWDVVVGNRRHPGSRVERASGVRAWGSRLVHVLARVVLESPPLDTQCGLKGFRGDVARRLFAATRVDGFAIDIEVLHLVERAGLSLTDIPVDLDERGGSTTVRLSSDVFGLARDVVRVRRWSRAGAYDEITPFPDRTAS